MSTAELLQPWAPTARALCLPRSVVFTLALGEQSERIPGRQSVRRGRDKPAPETGHGALDRVLRAFGGSAQITRVHEPARGRTGHDFDLLEHAQGLSRTYVAKFDRIARVDDVVDALRQLGVVTQASLDFLTPAHFGPGAAAVEAAAQAPASWPWDMIGAERARAIESGDPSVVAAVLDTGASVDHPELTGRLGSGFDAVNFTAGDLTAGLQLLGDFGGRDRDPGERDNPHGTACLAIIGGHGRKMPRGLSLATSLMPVRVLASARKPGRAGEHGSVVGLGAMSDIDFSITRAVALGAKVLNCSFGTAEAELGQYDPLPHADPIAYALERGAVVVAASGNSGKSERYYPAAFDGVVTVGSVGAGGRPSNFTTTGPHIDLCAPGERILTPGITGYRRVTGTSFAAPFVSATAALLVARAQRAAEPVNSEAIGAVLRASARPWTGVRPEGAGVGILDAARALETLDQQLAARAAGEGWQ